MVGTERGGNEKSSSRLTHRAHAPRVLEPLIDIRCAITSSARACRAEFFNRIGPNRKFGYDRFGGSRLAAILARLCTASARPSLAENDLPASMHAMRRNQT